MPLRLFALLTAGILLAASCRAQVPQDRFQRIAPAEAGFSSEGLEKLEAYLEESGTSSLVLAYDGKIFFEWGDIYRKHTIHSIRKALLNSLYGIYVDRGVIDTTATLASLGIDDIHPKLTTAEKQATIADLLKSRSGIYHPAAAESAGMRAAKPVRGTHAPGETHYYNNWDFNALGGIFEELTGKTIFEAFDEEIAQPLGMMQYAGDVYAVENPETMDDIPLGDGFYQYETDKSRFPAYHFRMSAHDLALYGSLYLNGGRWRDRQLVPASWIDASTRAYSVTNPHVGIGYGLLWYVLMPNEERSTKSFFHTGVGIHMLGIYPASKLVFVHRVDTERDTEFTPDRLYRIIGLVFGAREDDLQP